ncbi:Putative peptidoglycan binding domain-containing protein [Prosthecobacter debontii]|uniref:non-specific serine/threonine protein kinase n=1 Tax=Prosthecobacter debontii TaxID=48467 RepID=A0A1T4XMT5_9BACT|nr:protein kinase [Prosthecobacter debontii]SKA90713.1 Putative peptidoglycan binding domain-containing protein [Prosthecobacter debontii]
MITLPASLCHFDFERFQRKDPLGESWRAINRQSGEKVDLRLLPEWVSTASLEAFISSLTHLNHPNLIATRGLAVEPPLAAVVLESYDGETILQRRARRPRRYFEVSEIKPWLRSMVEVLEYLHEMQIPHGALYGGSFLIDGTDLKLTDLAVSRLLRPQPQFDGASALPPAVLSPQILQGHPPSVADDIYALGALLYDLLTSVPVFSSGDIATQVVNTVPVSVHERRAQLEIQSVPIPHAWEAWIASALAKDPIQRPSLGDLAELLRSGTFRGSGASNSGLRASSKASDGAQAGAPIALPLSERSSISKGSEDPSSKPNAPSIFSNHLLIIGGIVLCVLVSGGLLYFLKIAPRNEFRGDLTKAFMEAQAYDLEHSSEHAAVLDHWDVFIRNWQTRVTVEYPDFQPILQAAKEQRQTRADEKDHAEELARQEAEEARRLYLKKVRAQYLTVQAKAASLSEQKPLALAAWEAFLKEADIGYQGAKPDELNQELTDARASRDSLLKAIEEEKRLLEEQRQKAEGELARLRQFTADPNAGAAYKIGLVETFLNQMSAAPPDVLGDSKILEMRQAAETLLPALQLQAESETPKEPLDIKGIFPDLPTKDFSENGRKRLLKEAQALMKEQNFYSAEPDGGAGKNTHEAILAFQRAKNLVPSAALDTRTLVALGILDWKDDPSPMTSTTVARRRTTKKPQEEEKGFFRKVGDGATNVGKSIGGFFTGEKKK